MKDLGCGSVLVIQPENPESKIIEAFTCTIKSMRDSATCPGMKAVSCLIDEFGYEVRILMNPAVHDQRGYISKGGLLPVKIHHR